MCVYTHTHTRTHTHTQTLTHCHTTHARTTASPPTTLCAKAGPGDIPEKAVLDPKMAAAKFKELGNLKYKEGNYLTKLLTKLLTMQTLSAPMSRLS